MATGFQQLNSTILLTAAAAAHFTNAADNTAHLTGMILHNTHSAGLLVYVYIVPNNGGSVGTAAAGNQIFRRTIDAYETFPINDLTFYLTSENDTIQAYAATASKVTLYLEGYIEDTS